MSRIVAAIVVCVVIAGAGLAALLLVPGLRKANNAGDPTAVAARPTTAPVTRRPPRFPWGAGPPGVAPAPAAAGPAVGKEAPQVEGSDADGKKFKLSDYRGKVVLLDFWGNW
jgi:hypothetical protein